MASFDDVLMGGMRSFRKETGQPLEEPEITQVESQQSTDDLRERYDSARNEVVRPTYRGFEIPYGMGIEETEAWADAIDEREDERERKESLSYRVPRALIGPGRYLFGSHADPEEERRVQEEYGFDPVKGEPEFVEDLREGELRKIGYDPIGSMRRAYKIMDEMAEKAILEDDVESARNLADISSFRDPTGVSDLLSAVSSARLAYDRPDDRYRHLTDTAISGLAAAIPLVGSGLAKQILLGAPDVTDAAKAAPDAPAPVFESALERAVTEKAPNKLGVDDVEKFLEGKGAKKSEIADTKVPDFVAAAKAEGKKSVTKDELIQHLEDNKVQIEEVRLSNKLQDVPKEIQDLAIMKGQYFDLLEQDAHDLSRILAPDNPTDQVHRFSDNPTHFKNLYVDYTNGLDGIRDSYNVPDDVGDITSRVINLGRDSSVSDWTLKDAALITEARTTVNAKLADPEYQKFVADQRIDFIVVPGGNPDVVKRAHQKIRQHENLQKIARVLNEMPEAESRLAALRKFQSSEDYKAYAQVSKEYKQKYSALKKETGYLAPRWEEYTVPGGEDYQEILLTVPTKRYTELPEGFEVLDVADVYKNENSRGYYQVFRDGAPVGGSRGMFRTPEEAKQFAIDEINEADDWDNFGKRKKFTDSHHGNIPNVMVHIRIKTRIDSKGRRILFVEEIQSDWHQKGRKRGYTEKENQQKIEEAKSKLRKLEKERNEIGEIEDLDSPKLKEANKEVAKQARLVGIIEQGPVSEAPIKDIKEWTSLSIKRIFREAAEQGYDGVAFSRSDVITPLVTLPRDEAVGMFGNPETFLDRLAELKQRGGQYEEGAEQAEKVFGGNQYYYDKLIPSIAKRETKAKQGTTLIDVGDISLEVPFFELTKEVKDKVIKPQKLYSVALPGIAVGAAAAEEEELSAAAALGAIGLGGMALYKGMKGARAAKLEGLTDLKGNTPKLNDDGTITLYHRTTPEAAAEIRRTGKFVSKENTDEIFLSSKPTGQAEGYGSEVVEVRVDPAKVRLDDAFDDEIHVAVKTADVPKPPAADEAAKGARAAKSPETGERFMDVVGTTPTSQMSTEDLLSEYGKLEGRDLLRSAPPVDSPYFVQWVEDAKENTPALQARRKAVLTQIEENIYAKDGVPPKGQVAGKTYIHYTDADTADAFKSGDIEPQDFKVAPGFDPVTGERVGISGGEASLFLSLDNDHWKNAVADYRGSAQAVPIKLLDNAEVLEIDSPESLISVFKEINVSPANRAQFFKAIEQAGYDAVVIRNVKDVIDMGPNIPGSDFWKFAEADQIVVLKKGNLSPVDVDGARLREFTRVIDDATRPPSVPDVSKPPAAAKGARAAKNLKSTVRDIESSTGAELVVSDRSDQGILVLRSIKVAEDQRGTGKASDAMKQLIDYADQTGKQIALTPEAIGTSGLSSAQLKKWYSSLGFVPNKGKVKRFEVSETMIREPRALAPKPPAATTDIPDESIQIRGPMVFKKGKGYIPSSKEFTVQDVVSDIKDWSGDPDTKVLYHSGDASVAGRIHEGLEPQTGDWVREVLEGATDDADLIEYVAGRSAISFLSDTPDWVISKVARKIGKHQNEVTLEDIKKHGHLSVFKVDADDRSVLHAVDPSYEKFTNVTGSEEYSRWHETPLYEESDIYTGQGGLQEVPFGVEPGDYFTTEGLMPEYTLTGDSLVEFLRHKSHSHPTLDVPKPPAPDAPKTADRPIESVFDDFGEVDFSLDNAARKLAKDADMGITRDRELHSVIRNEDGEVIAAQWRSFDNENYEFDVIVAPEYRGTGLGSRLIDDGISGFDEMLDVNPDSTMRLTVTSDVSEAALARRGFKVVEDDGRLKIMERPVPAAAMKLPETPDEINKAFNELASHQRYLPEEAMLDLTRLTGGVGSFYADLAEHIGDLTHRMSEYGGRMAYATPKIKLYHRRLHNPYGFEKEMLEVAESNFNYAKKRAADGSTDDYTLQAAKYESFDDAMAHLKSLGQTYADEHRKLPVYNEVQRLGNDAAIAVGEFRFDDAREILTTLKKYADEGDDAFKARQLRVEPEFARFGSPPDNIAAVSRELGVDSFVAKPPTADAATAAAKAPKATKEVEAISSRLDDFEAEIKKLEDDLADPSSDRTRQHRAALTLARIRVGVDAGFTLSDAEQKVLRNRGEELYESLFKEMGLIQRGDPEDAGQALRHLSVDGTHLIPDPYGQHIEDVGDLTHRMSHYAYEPIRKKVKDSYEGFRDWKGLSAVYTDDVNSNVLLQYAFDNAKNNYGYTGSYESYIGILRSAGQKYADEHRKVPVYNEVQRLANDAAIALGEFRFVDARDNLKKLNDYIKQGEDAFKVRLTRLESEFARPGSLPTPTADAATAAAKTDTPEFKRWSGGAPVIKRGDAALKRGNDIPEGPVVFEVYHGTGRDFDTFEYSTIGTATDTGYLGEGFYATTDPEWASKYAQKYQPGGSVMPLYMKLENPLHLKRSDSGFEYDPVLEKEVPIDREGHIRDVLDLPRDASGQEVADVLRAKGYDGVTYRGHIDVGIKSQDIEVMVLDQYNIKSQFNPGTFDPNDPSILKGIGVGAAVPAAAAVRSQRQEEEGNPLTEPPEYRPMSYEGGYNQSIDFSETSEIVENILSISNKHQDLFVETSLIEAEYASLSDEDKFGKRGEVLNEWYEKSLDTYSELGDKLDESEYDRYLMGKDVYYETNPNGVQHYDDFRLFSNTGVSVDFMPLDASVRKVQEDKQRQKLKNTIHNGGPMLDLFGPMGELNRYLMKKAMFFEHPVQTIQLNDHQKRMLSMDNHNLESLKDSGLVSYLLYKELLGSVKLL